jgi:prolyl oligopeptidase PreP (S9A serine peptidase family)
MIRDLELNRLVQYAKGIGLIVKFKPRPRGGDAAEWDEDGPTITIFTNPWTTKVEKILSLIHEISHMRSYIENERQLDPKIEEALLSEEDKKSYRKRIYDMEKSDSAHWESIYKDTNCQFNINKLYIQREVDLYQYSVYYETGKFPTGKENKKKRRELKNRYRK